MAHATDASGALSYSNRPRCRPPRSPVLRWEPGEGQLTALRWHAMSRRLIVAPTCRSLIWAIVKPIQLGGRPRSDVYGDRAGAAAPAEKRSQHQ